MKMGASLSSVFRRLQHCIVRWNLFGATVAAVLFSSAPCYAIVIGLDQFSITRNGGAFFTDNFSDGIPPPSAPSFASGASASYGIQGTIPSGAESGGLLQVDSANGRPGTNIDEASRLSLIVTLLSSAAGGATQIGVGNTFVETGLFNLLEPPGPLFSGYGIRLTDNGGAGPHQIVHILVEFNETDGLPEIVYTFGDFDTNTTTILGVDPFAPPVGADQIRLTLARPSILNDDIFASFSYLSGGAVVGGGSFATPGLMFQGENFVRGQFIVGQAEPVPEPGTAWFFVPGIALLAAGFGTRHTTTRLLSRAREISVCGLAHARELTGISHRELFARNALPVRAIMLQLSGIFCVEPPHG
jgi:hypothetical protein